MGGDSSGDSSGGSSGDDKGPIAKGYCKPWVHGCRRSLHARWMLVKADLKEKDEEVKTLRGEVKQLMKVTEVDENSKARFNDLRFTHNSLKDDLERQKMRNAELR